MRKALLLQTLLREWAYGQPYFSSKLRTAALRPWLRYYDEHGPNSLNSMPRPSAAYGAPREQPTETAQPVAFGAAAGASALHYN
ncbi:MAG TPA: hypothetical protein VE755_05575 [Myxococcales bacterium]|nr:hypothetical protein [Myxococcales bacterium]